MGKANFYVAMPHTASLLELYDSKGGKMKGLTTLLLDLVGWDIRTDVFIFWEREEADDT